MRENYERFVFAPAGSPDGTAKAVWNFWSILIDDVNCNREVRPSPHATENGGVLALGICRCFNTKHVSTTCRMMEEIVCLTMASTIGAADDAAVRALLQDGSGSAANAGQGNKKVFSAAVRCAPHNSDSF